jgi:hypothetical protein
MTESGSIWSCEVIDLELLMAWFLLVCCARLYAAWHSLLVAVASQSASM